MTPEHHTLTFVAVNKPIRRKNLEILGGHAILREASNIAESIRRLSGQGFRLLTSPEAFDIPEAVKNSLKGKHFWISGEGGMDKEGLHHLGRNGKLVRGRGPSIEETIRVLPGKGPLAVFILSDDGATRLGARFLLIADYNPGELAPVVVGVPKDQALSDLVRKPN